MGSPALKIMRYTKTFSLPSFNDTRTITYFAWSPVTIITRKNNGDYITERRWLEQVTILQRYHVISGFRFGWDNVEFVDD